VEAYLPIELLRKDFRRGREIGWQPLFHGYMFARCDLGRDLPRLLEIEGVADVLRSSPIADEVIETTERSSIDGIPTMLVLEHPHCHSPAVECLNRHSPLAALVAERTAQSA
jgi:hypothetical protein